MSGMTIFFEYGLLGLFHLIFFVSITFYEKEMKSYFIAQKEKLKKMKQVRNQLRNFKNIGQISWGEGYYLYMMYLISWFIIICYFWYVLNSDKVLYWSLSELGVYYSTMGSFISGVTALIYKAQNLFCAVKVNLVGVFSLMNFMNMIYLMLNNFFMMFLVLEVQAVLLVYFILTLLVLPRGEYLKKVLKSAENFAKQPKMEMNSALFSQFWASFFSAFILFLAIMKLLAVVKTLFLSQFLGIISYSTVKNSSMSSMNCFLMLFFLMCSFFLKGGLAPFYFWKPELYSSLSLWGLTFFLTSYTFSIFFLFMIIFACYFIMLIQIYGFIIQNILIMGVMSLCWVLYGVTELKVFLVYMSLFHGTFMMVSIMADQIFGLSLGIFYIFLYLMVMIEFFCSLLVLNSNSFNYLTDLKKLNSCEYCLILLVLTLLGMSGMPPFFCFWAKMGIVVLLFKSGFWISGIIIMTVGLFLLYFYFQNYSFVGSSDLYNNDFILYIEKRAEFIMLLGMMLSFLNCLMFIFLGDYWFGVLFLQLLV